MSLVRLGTPIVEVHSHTTQGLLMKTVMITGCSSGFGLEIAHHFLGHDWNVIATMRVPREDVLPRSDRLRVMALDVTNPDSIHRAMERTGPIDVLVNNAGIGAACPFELTSLEQSRALFETNTFGAMALTQAVLPQFRERRAGVVVNVSSSVTLGALPLVSVYSASKAAVNALTRSMAIELEPFGIRTHLVLPGRSPETQFGTNAHIAGMDHERLRGVRTADTRWYERGLGAGHLCQRRRRSGLARGNRSIVST